MDKTDLIHSLYDLEIIKFGRFTLKDATVSPYYIDLRLLVSYPWLLRSVTKQLCELIRDNGLRYTHIAGIPLAGIPLATLVSVELDTPGLLIRKEVKNYGLQKAIEGCYMAGESVLLIDDVVTSANSKKEVIAILEQHGLHCNDIVVVIDRRQVVSTDLRIYALLTMLEIVSTLLAYKRVTPEDRQRLVEIMQQK